LEVVQNSVKPSHEQPEQSAPKRRGRPPKKPQVAPPIDLESPSPPPPRFAPVQKLLSLKEKLALKGKSFKIVAKKGLEPEASTSGPPSARSTPSILKPILKSPSIASPVGWGSVNEKSPPAGNYYATSPTESSSTKNVSFAPPEALPVKKGPTVVRLVSPDSDFEESGAELSEGSASAVPVSDDSSDDDDIPAVRVSPKPLHGGGVSLRGRGGMTAKRGRRRGRPAAIKGI